MNYIPKTPLGMMDFVDRGNFRDKIIDIIKEVYKIHGGIMLDTPVCELTSTLQHGSYGQESSKLIYDLQDQGGELLSLRYDLTVPFARYCAINGIKSMRRYSIGKVYRRDRPNISHGRFREFYQCDFDILGNSAPYILEAECLLMMMQIFTKLGIQNYTIMVNSKNVLYNAFKKYDIQEEFFKTICSSLDKLDKVSWSNVREEIVSKTHIDYETADKLHEYLKNMEIPEELKQVFDYSDKSCLKFNPFLARGLDYYTGIIYEVVINGESSIGSIAGGGRYDGLISKFNPSITSPCIGFSIGLERIIAYKSGGNADVSDVSDVYDVYVAEINTVTRFSICNILWNSGAKTYYNNNMSTKFITQCQEAEKMKIPIMVYFGPEEIKNGIVKIRRYTYSKIIEKTEELCKIDDLVTTIQKYL